MMSLDMPDARQPYQSFVPMVGDSIAAIFEHYLEQSEQQPSRLFATAGPKAAVCLFLQKMPEADQHDRTAGSASPNWPATVKPPNCSNSTPKPAHPTLPRRNRAPRHPRL
jgi:molecular chaperone Hsp33